MRHPRRRKPTRTRRWEGVVEEIDSETMWVRLIPSDHEGVDLAAEIDIKRLPGATVGMLFTLYGHSKGRKVRTVLNRRVLKAWTPEQLAEFDRQAVERAMIWTAMTREGQ